MENWFEFALKQDEGMIQLIKHFYKKVLKPKIEKLKVVSDFVHKWLPKNSMPIVNNYYQIYGEIVCQDRVRNDFFRSIHQNPHGWDQVIIRVTTRYLFQKKRNDIASMKSFKMDF